MGSSSGRLFNRQRTIHEIFGGAFVADVVLWRQRNITMGILILTLIIWLVFEESGYTLLSLISSILLLLITILFVWSKAASLLNRPAPPLPDMHLREEVVSEMGELARDNINSLVLVCRNVALGKDSRLFLRVAACLLMISVFGALTDIVTLCYMSLAILLTIPALYERYDDQIDKYMMSAYRSVQRIRVNFDYCITMIRKMDLEKFQ
ncbi:reticulon-like protein B12 [Chenopodium quinoa]|uniref:reticulon-like protein B12 n=1 Tax=Chenopodium quinoa TaxID=63459 RepID=UPI000B785F01|nr:reticulon-like protein B12 [Chenopodium quinoa]